MSDLLRLADELMDARDEATPGEWILYPGSIDAVGGVPIAMDPDMKDEDITFIVQAANYAVDIIKGYQDLLRRIVDVYENTTVDETYFQLMTHIRYAKASIPEGKTNE